MARISTPLSQKFDLRLPLFLAPMAGGPTTPELVAAVNESGGMGFLGVAYMKPVDIEKNILRVRELTKRPLGVNLFVPSSDPVISSEQMTTAIAKTEKYRNELHLPKPEIKPPYSENFEAQFEMVLKRKPESLSFTFGLLDSVFIRACRAQGIFVIGTATTLAEAHLLEQSGVDAIVLQGVEAGGHRGIFDIASSDPEVHALDLTRACAREIKVPLITAGGIMDGKGIAAALEAGAQAAQLGTAFLLCEEAGTSAPYRQALQAQGKKKTQLTRAFSGRLARGIENRFLLEMKGEPILPWPALNVFTRDLRKASTDKGSSDFLSLWAGTGVDHVRPMKAAALVETLLKELQSS